MSTPTVNLSPGTEALDCVTGTVAHLKAVADVFGGRVFDAVADFDDGTPVYPFAVVSLDDDRDTLTQNGRRVITHVDVQVKSVSRARSFADVADRVAQIDAAMDTLQATPSTFGVHRIRSFSRVIVDGGDQYREVGGVYRMQVHALS